MAVKSELQDLIDAREDRKDAKDVDVFPVELINIRHPFEKVCINKIVTGPRGRQVKVWDSMETVRFTEHRLFVDDQFTLDYILEACPYVFKEYRSGKYFKDDKSGFTCRNPNAFNAWMNSDWR
jgi:hypothetical protein